MARNVNMRSKHLALCCAFCLAVSPATAEALRGDSMLSLAQATAEPAPAAPAQIQNVQRLLKLLADRYPKKYGSVDPGRVDGSYGAETKDAIRNFQRISGSKASPQNGEQLVADILATLAQMSATQAADTGIDSTPKAAPPEAESPAPEVAATPPDDAPKPETPKVAAPSAAEAPQAEGPKPDVAAAPAPAAETKIIPADPPKAAKPKPAPAQAGVKGQRVFFVQAASLKSLESAKREWRKIFEENRAALTGEQVYFEKANVGDRGLFFRILIGPMSERDAAKTLCSFLQQNGQTCVVTSRDPAELEKATSEAGSADKAMPEKSAAPDRSGQGTAPAPSPQPAQTKAAVTDAPVAAEADRPNSSLAAKASVSTPDATQPSAPSANGPDHGSPQKPAAADPAAPPAEAPATASAEPGPQASTTGATVNAAPGTAETQASAVSPAAEPAPSKPAPAPSPAPAADPVPQAQPAGQAGQSESTPAATNGSADPRPSSAIMDTAHAVVARLSQQPDKVAGIAAALIIATGAAVYGWRRRNRRLSLSQFFQSAALPVARAPSESAGPMEDLETDFGSDSLQQSRLTRDSFLRDTLGTETGDESMPSSDDSAMRINSSLKALLVKEPAQYKSIFLNWIFLAKVGAALNNKEISFEQLSEHISREFDLLQTYFKIHLLELDDRHRIRQELPGLFYCLQLTQMKKRQNSAKFSAA
jgi:hypothetical protein